jgi:prolyl-tRNA synthetase
MDEKKARLGVMLADVELMGIPHRLVIGDRGLENEAIEYKYRRDAESSDIKLSELDAFLAEALSVD